MVVNKYKFTVLVQDRATLNCGKLGRLVDEWLALPTNVHMSAGCPVRVVSKGGTPLPNTSGFELADGEGTSVKPFKCTELVAEAASNIVADARTDCDNAARTAVLHSKLTAATVEARGVRETLLFNALETPHNPVLWTSLRQHLDDGRCDCKCVCVHGTTGAGALCCGVAGWQVLCCGLTSGTGCREDEAVPGGGCVAGCTEDALV